MEAFKFTSVNKENVVYEPGIISAKGYVDGNEILTHQVETTDSPFMIELVPDRKVIKGDGHDVAIITTEILDKNGLTVPTADNLIHYSIEGTGRLLGVGNGNPASHESDKQPIRRAFHGMCQIIVQSFDTEGEIKVIASSEGIKKSSCIIRVQVNRE